jgi:tetratricopeptide (TPR) repeat protein
VHKYQLTRQRTWEGQAAAACDRAAKLDPNAPDLLLALGELHLAGRRWSESLVEFDRALAARPELYEALLGKARVLDALQRPAEAEATVQRAIELRPDDWRGHHAHGMMLFLKGRYEDALGPWAKVTELTPDNAIAHTNLGAAFFNIDRFQEAETVILRSLAIRPSAMACYNLGTLLYFLERYDDCVDAFERAVELNPADPVAWGNLGNACRQIAGRERRAAEALESAIGLMRERLARAPNSGDGWARLAGYLVGRGQRAESEAAVARALENSPHDPNCLWMAGHTYYLLGRRGEALRCLADAVHRGYGVDALRHDPDLKSLETDPEFLRILEEGSSHRRAAHAD